MEAIANFFASKNLDFEKFLKSTAILVVSLLALALIGRILFKKKSDIINAVSAAIGILFIYAVTVILCGLGPGFQKFIAPLPFVSIENKQMILFQFHADYTVVTTHILSMIVLAFLMNLVDSVLPTGKNVIIWLIFRCVSVVAGIVLHLIVTGLLNKYLPEGLRAYAPTILLGVLALMLLTGALKFLVGIVLSTVNPLIAALYTFFFANAIGRQVTKAVLTTLILSVLVWILQKLGIFTIAIVSAALIAYIPFIVILLALWYVVGRLL